MRRLPWRVLAFGVLAVVLGLAAVGCAPTPESGTETPASTQDTSMDQPASGMPTKDQPMVVDKEGKKIHLYAEVNRKYVTQPTRHGIVSADGGNADMSIFKAQAKVMDVHAELIPLGAEPGDNIKPDSPPGTKTEGDELDITVVFDGRSWAIGDLITSTGELGGKPLAARFGGNKETQTKKKTGCIYCLDSCAAGITSNPEVGWKSFEEGKVEFRAVGDKLPAEDGAPVVITLALK